jgi:hypothetical protein
MTRRTHAPAAPARNRATHTRAAQARGPGPGTCAVASIVAAAIIVAALAIPAPAAAQQATAAVVPSEITVGDVFHAVLRVTLPAGASAVAPDSLVLPDDLELAGRREFRTDTVDGVPRLSAIYPLTAWRPGTYDLPGVTLGVVRDGRQSTLTVSLPSFEVTSVLPGDTTDITPREAKDVLGGNRVWWPIILALLLALAVAAALWYWWRRRQQPEPQAEPAPVVVIPREEALARLDALRQSQLIERGEVREYYGRLTETLRQYAASLDPSWSGDLTTSELAMRMDGARGGAELLRILGGADMVKFARAAPEPAAAYADLDAARRWVEHAEPPRSTDSSGGSNERSVA